MAHCAYYVKSTLEAGLIACVGLYKTNLQTLLIALKAIKEQL